jgi:glycosyltransferase involved in cell wall biosynthesis
MRLSGNEQEQEKTGILRVAMFAPMRRRCGISDYSRLLLSELNLLPNITVRMVEAPEDVVSRSGLHALTHYASEERRFRSLGSQLNHEANGNLTDVAHIQHQYFFFGGVAPHRSHLRALLSAVRIPLIMTVHEIAEAGSPSPFLIKAAVLLANRRNFLHPAIDRLLVHTGLDRERLLTLGVPDSRIQVVTHGVPRAEPMPDSSTAKRYLGMEGRRVVTLFGFLAVKKGHRVALKAIRRLPEDVLLLFAGDRHPDDHSDYVPNLLAEIARLNLSDRVRISGYLPEERIPDVMAATDVAIAPFLQSSGSGSLANLMAYGRPIVASDIAPHREIASETPSPIVLFESGDAEALAVQIQRLLEDAASRTALQSAALSYASRHSYTQMARETAAIYQEVCH